MTEIWIINLIVPHDLMSTNINALTILVIKLREQVYIELQVPYQQ